MYKLQRLNKKEKAMIKKLAIQGWSLNKISRELRLPKSTVYYWFRKAVGRKIKKIEIKESLKEEIGEIVGAFAGDGNYYVDKKYHHRIRFHFGLNELELAKRIKNLIFKVYNKKMRLYFDFLQREIILRIYSKKIALHLKKYLWWRNKKVYTVKLRSEVESYSLDFIKGFVRGLIEAEGWIDKGNLKIACVSPDLIDNLSGALRLLKIPHSRTCWRSNEKNKKDRHAIILSRYWTKILTKRIMPPAGVSG